MQREKRVPDCHPDKPYAGRGLCRNCYMAAQRAGSLPDAPLRGKLSRTPTCHPERDHWSGGLCKECYMAKWRAEHPEERRAAVAKWKLEHPDRVALHRARDRERNKKGQDARHYAKNPDAARARTLKSKYNATAEEFQTLLVAQGHVCAICRLPEGRRKLSIDHDHATGQQRGLLCDRCNLAIGMFKDNPTLLLAAVAYLEVHNHDDREEGS